jgi:hypothetical protein
MAIPFANTQETFDTVGVREDLTDLIYMISPTETPFMMMVGRGTCYSFKHEWQMDKLDAAADNKQIEGHKVAAADIEAVDATVRLVNYTQISDKHISITGTTEVVNKAGRNSELSYQLSKRSKEIKRDLERAMVGVNNASVIGLSGTARESASVQTQFHASWYQSGPGLSGTHISRGPGSGTPGADGGWDNATGLFDAATDADATRPLLESQLKGVIQGAWTNGGDPTVIMTGPFNKTVISGFTGGSTRFDRSEDKRLVAAIDVYVSDFGEHTVVPNRFQRERDVLVLTPELYKVCYLRPFHQQALAKIGDSEERSLRVEWTLELNNNAGSGIVADLNAS